MGTAAYIVLIALAFTTMRDLTTRGLERSIPSDLRRRRERRRHHACRLSGCTFRHGLDHADARSLGLVMGICRLPVRCHTPSSLSLCARGRSRWLHPFAMSPPPLSVAVGYWWWGDMPDTLAFLGIGLVVAAGLYTLHRERHGLTGRSLPVPRKGAPRNEAQPHEGEDRARRAGARLLGDVSLATDRRDAGLCRLRLGADRLRARQHRPRPTSS